jgi:ligand-binding sensor domain-containing protein
VSLAQDLQGNIWAGTEDKGVFCYDPKASEDKQWTQFNTKNGLGDDNAYAIAVDKLGRVWVGTLNHGVSVYNFKEWKNYDVLDGPIGERTFAITTCPTDGDVWIATSAGLTRYSLKQETWSYYTRADGLPEDQANAIAFDSAGDIYVGTQCHGIAVAKAAEEYKKWAVVRGPGVQLPVTPTGTGLPTSLINGVLVARDGAIYAATTAGLAWSKDKGKTWQYLRGRDYGAKVKGRWGGAPAGWTEAPKPVMDMLLPEDYVTCVAQDDSGLVWLGFRQQGYLAFDPKTNRHVFEGNQKGEGLVDNYVLAFLHPSDFRPWIATYGGGVGLAKHVMKAAGVKQEAGAPSKGAADVPPFPRRAEPPTLVQTREKLAAVKETTSAKPPTEHMGVALPDDWTTQGKSRI